MTHAGIECFLAVCRYKTGSAAAQALYITQSSLSTRLKILEKELGGRLFDRRNGCREMKLTPAGKEFYKLALQYEALTEKMQQVCHKAADTLRISSVNSLATYVLPSVYELFHKKHPTINLELQDMKLPGVSSSIRNGETDWALTAGKNTDTTLVQTPIFSEPMVLICSCTANYPKRIQAAHLPPDKEVYIHWNDDFSEWHQQFLGEMQSQLRVSIMAHLSHFMERDPCWAIVPATVAHGLNQEGCIRFLQTDIELPHRVISLLTSAETENKAVYKAFVDCLQQIVTQFPNIELLLTEKEQTFIE